MSVTGPTQSAERKRMPVRQGVAQDRPEPAIDMAEPQDRDPLALQRAVEDPGRARPADILALQRTAGNRAVSRHIQAKLTVGPASDSHEQEADRVADQVLSMPARVARPARADRVQRQIDEEEVQTKPLAAGITPLVQRQIDEEEVQTKPLLQRQAVPEEEEVQTKPLAAGITPLVQRQIDEEEVQTKPLLQRQAVPEEEEVQTKPDDRRHAPGAAPDPAGSFQASGDFERQLSGTRGGGSPLPAGVRRQMEAGFGADFGDVRIHVGSQAANLNRQVSAQAFTHNKDIYLGAGQPDMASPAGKRLLAHELTHTIQQTGAPVQRWGKVAQAKPIDGIQRTEGAVVQRLGLSQIVGALSDFGKKVTTLASNLKPGAGKKAGAAPTAAAQAGPEKKGEAALDIGTKNHPLPQPEWAKAAPKGPGPKARGPMAGAQHKPQPVSAHWEPQGKWEEAGHKGPGPKARGPMIGAQHKPQPASALGAATKTPRASTGTTAAPPQKPRGSMGTPAGIGAQEPLATYEGMEAGAGTEGPLATYEQMEAGTGAEGPLATYAGAEAATPKKPRAIMSGSGQPLTSAAAPPADWRQTVVPFPHREAPPRWGPEDLSEEKARDYVDKLLGHGFQWLSQAGQAWADNPKDLAAAGLAGKGLSRAEQTAITTYTCADYVYMNPSLASNIGWLRGALLKRGGEAGWSEYTDMKRELQDVTETAGGKEKGMEKAETLYKTMQPEGLEHAKWAISGLKKLNPYVGDGFRGLALNREDYEKTYKEGSVYHQDAFGSTATDPAPCSNFMDGDGVKKANVFCTIAIKTARDISQLSNIPTENEVLTLPDSDYYVQYAEPWRAALPGNPLQVHLIEF